MKEPRKGHSRRCRSVECRAENTGDDHLFRNPLSKWYRGRRRSKDDEAQLLGAEYDAGHESGSSQQQARSGSQQPVTKSSSAVPPAITRPPKRPCPPGPPPTHRPPPAPTAAFGGPQVRVSLPEEDLSTRTKQAAGHQASNLLASSDQWGVMFFFCSVVHSKPGHQEIISIPKSRFLVVAALLSFVMVACFCIAIYSFSVPADHWRGNASTKPPNLAQSVPPAPTPTSAVLINTTAANVSAVMSAAPKLAQDQPLALLQPQRTDNRSLRSRPRFVIL
ncbi:hypothetical protein V5799_015269 [Amblyomma americanum]|uniref:Transmembrane protein n=1 Tax=Amblyomma americanum TaxID=6943 RepID=A0AAQ4E0M5_AMBAM